MKTLITFITLAILSGAENAQAAACPSGGDQTISVSCTLAPGTYSYGDLIISSPAIISTSGAVVINTTNVTISSGATLSAVGSGNAAGAGTGAGSTSTSGGGGGYGGAGGNGNGGVGGAAYILPGTLIAPTALGSGGGGGSGGAGAAGGGAIKITASGGITIDGTIDAGGANSADSGGGGTGGGGSGGSIWITAATLEGSGAIQANGGLAGIYTPGGPYRGGGGAGGRISLNSTNNTFAGTVSVAGGLGLSDGNIGSIYVDGSFTCSGEGSVTYPSADLADISNLVIDNGCNFSITGALNIPTLTASVGPSTAATLNFINAATISALVVNNGSTVNVNSQLTTGTDVTLSGASTIRTASGVAAVISVTNIYVNSGSSLSATGKGFAPGGGTGAGVSGQSGGGAGYGGAGASAASGEAGGIAYFAPGTLTEPTALGSGGGAGSGTSGGAGGGAIKIIASGLVSVSGTIDANGADSNTAAGGGTGGGGSGGSIWIISSVLAGNGSILANGGLAGIYIPGGPYRGGGGSGGRIALESTTNNFTGSTSVQGGVGYLTGSSGSVYKNGEFSCSAAGSVTYSAADFPSLNNLVVDNGCSMTITGGLNLPGLTITVGPTAASTLRFSDSATISSLIVDNGSTVHVNSALTTGGNITVAGVSTINTTAGVPAAVSVSNFNLNAGSKLSGLGMGSAAGAGTGAGATSTSGGGGGYGGIGGSGNGGTGGISYLEPGTLTQPIALGSGGGAGSGGSGAAGGGAIKVVASGTITIDGTIDTNGADSASSGGGGTGGGGSGGSIWITASVLAGAGTIKADGGTAGIYTPGGPYRGGGGAGGRISLSYQTKTFSGSISVMGGIGLNNGGTGTSSAAQSGVYLSSVLDFGTATLAYQTLSYTKTTPGTTAVSVDVRTGNSPAPDGTWTSWATFASGDSLAVFTGNRYLQYRATLSTSDANKPTLDSITINAPACYSTGSYYYVKTTAANKFLSARSNTVSNVAITSSVPGSTALKALVSFDGGTTWKKHNSSSWVDAAGGVSTIGTTGNTMAELISGLNGYTFGASEPTVDFAFGLESDSCSATPSVTELRFDY